MRGNPFKIILAFRQTCVEGVMETPDREKVFSSNKEELFSEDASKEDFGHVFASRCPSGKALSSSFRCKGKSGMGIHCSNDPSTSDELDPSGSTELRQPRTLELLLLDEERSDKLFLSQISVSNSIVNPLESRAGRLSDWEKDEFFKINSHDLPVTLRYNSDRLGKDWKPMNPQIWDDIESSKNKICQESCPWLIEKYEKGLADIVKRVKKRIGERMKLMNSFVGDLRRYQKQIDMLSNQNKILTEHVKRLSGLMQRRDQIRNETTTTTPYPLPIQYTEDSRNDMIALRMPPAEEPYKASFYSVEMQNFLNVSNPDKPADQAPQFPATESPESTVDSKTENTAMKVRTKPLTHFWPDSFTPQMPLRSSTETQRSPEKTTTAPFKKTGGENFNFKNFLKNVEGVVPEDEIIGHLVGDLLTMARSSKNQISSKGSSSKE
ncbi:unnamed protein product [Cyprideis torosa]|uniref:Uncharacterized protein n=1 Tax=Cyprideis torosa TaxID=163714 RepID=A0A7R8WAG0_9CRUS|nr:unnamed protein product [Cyprideis torosa]CAG0890985.1 unnamed protein product [Cyprideis torosa]